MQNIPIRLAKEGMELRKDALDPQGRVLCGAGTRLTQEIISRLTKAGIESIVVRGHPVLLPGEKPLKERIQELEKRFQRVMDDPVQRALMKLIAEYWIKTYRG